MADTFPQPTPPALSSVEDQLAELRATLANLHVQMLDHHAKTKEILVRLMEATDLSHRSIDNLQVRVGALEIQQSRIDYLREQLVALDHKMRTNDADLAEAIALLLDEEVEEQDALPAPLAPPAPALRYVAGCFAGSGKHSPVDGALKGGAMTIMMLYLEDSIQGVLQASLEAEGYTVMATQSATQALHAIEDNNDIDTLLADNFRVNPEAQRAFTLLSQHPELRQRVTVVGLSGIGTEYAQQWITDGSIDAHVSLPFTFDQLFAILKANGRYPTP